MPQVGPSSRSAAIGSRTPPDAPQDSAEQPPAKVRRQDKAVPSPAQVSAPVSVASFKGKSEVLDSPTDLSKIAPLTPLTPAADAPMESCEGNLVKTEASPSSHPEASSVPAKPSRGGDWARIASGERERPAPSPSQAAPSPSASVKGKPESSAGSPVSLSKLTPRTPLTPAAEATAAQVAVEGSDQESGAAPGSIKRKEEKKEEDLDCSERTEDVPGQTNPSVDSDVGGSHKEENQPPKTESSCAKKEGDGEWEQNQDGNWAKKVGSGQWDDEGKNGSWDNKENGNSWDAAKNDKAEDKGNWWDKKSWEEGSNNWDAVSLWGKQNETEEAEDWKWESKNNENQGNDNDGWGNEEYFPDLQNEEEQLANVEPIEYLNWYLDDLWNLWEPNSDEAISATVLVQKIRARTELEWERRLKLRVRGFMATTEKINGEYVQFGINESRPCFEHVDGEFYIYVADRQWRISPNLGSTEPSEIWAQAVQEEMVEGKSKVEVSANPPSGFWTPNLAHVAGRPQFSECEIADVPFPSEKAGDVFQGMVCQQVIDQRMLVSGLQWVEASVLEVTTVPPKLSDAIVNLFKQELEALRSVCKRVPGTRMLARAKAPIPLPKVRKAAQTMLQDLREQLFEKLGGSSTFEDFDNFKEVIDDVLGHTPWTVQILCLVHAYEFTHLKNNPYADGDAFAVALAKLNRPERAIEMVCRMTLWEAIRLASNAISKEMETEQSKLRVGKIATLNRLFREWELNPTEDQLSQLHVFDLKTQLKILLLLERDIECYWAVTVSVAKDEEQKRQMLADFLDFQSLLQRHLGDDALRNSVDIENESKVPLEVFHLARARKCISDVLKTLKKKYGWSPNTATRVKMSKANWVARLAALLHLAHADDVIDADIKLRVLLQQEETKKLGTEVLDRFDHWHMVGAKDGKAPAMPKVIDRERIEQVEEKYLHYEPDPNVNYGLSGPMPATPAGIGSFAFGMPGMPGTPRLPGQTPGGWRPVSGTPAGLPPMTPGAFGSRTPVGMPPAGAGARFLPGTPAGPPPSTPGFIGVPSSRTPFGPPPATPGVFGGVFGAPSGAMPMTPNVAFGGHVATGAGSIPRTPVQSSFGAGASARVPQTPIQFGGVRAVPSTPSGAVPSTPAMVPQTPGTIPFKPFAGISSAGQPQTPGMVVPSTPGGAMVPRTPGGFGPTVGSIPFTPAMPHAAPMTPAGVMAQPFTPGAPQPFTPGPAGTSVPFTPAGPVPSTPAVK